MDPGTQALSTRALRILYTGTPSGTSLQRAEALRELGHTLRFIESGEPPLRSLRYQWHRVVHRLRPFPDLWGANAKLVATARAEPFDLVWVDKGLSFRPATFEALRRELPTGTPIVSFSPDDMSNPVNQSQRWRDAIGLYDLHVTTKSYNVAELRAAGARDAFFVANGYDPRVHHPIELSDAERRRFAADVSFIGIHEADRARQVERLVDAGVEVTVHSPHWSHLRGRQAGLSIVPEYLHGEDFARAIVGSRINLGFLRKDNRDLQTTRSVEIPACGGFLLAERTDEHLALFEEGVEAEFFDGADELIEKCRHYLGHEEQRAEIAARGLERCQRDDYSYAGRLRRVIEHLFGGAPS